MALVAEEEEGRQDHQQIMALHPLPCPYHRLSLLQPSFPPIARTLYLFAESAKQRWPIMYRSQKISSLTFILVKWTFLSELRCKGWLLGIILCIFNAQRIIFLEAHLKELEKKRVCKHC